MEIITRHNFTAHGDRLERLAGRLGGGGRLGLGDDLAARRDRLEGGVAVGAQGDLVAGLGAGGGAEALTVAPLGPARLRLDQTWRRRERSSGGSEMTEASVTGATFLCKLISEAPPGTPR